MKKVVKVNIGNLAFTLNEDAFEVLSRYLDDLKRHYSNKPSGFEVIEGIEERIAELFLEKCGHDNIVTIETVNEVISILGKPDDIDDDSKQSSSQQVPPSMAYVPKRFYRNPDNRVLGGVCGGLAAYFKIDPVVIRLIYAVLALGLTIVGPLHVSFFFMMVLYIVLWIVIPEAKTVEQKCAMYGESVDISNIQRRVVEEANKAGKSIRRAGQYGSDAVSDIFGAIGVAFGVILTIAGFAGILFLTIFFLGFEVIDGFFPVNIIDFINLGTIDSLWIKICGICLLFIPFIGMLMGGIQLVFRLKRSRFKPGLILAIIWWVSLFAMITFGAVGSKGYWEQYESENEKPMNFKGDTLFVKFESATSAPLSRTIFEADFSSATLLWYDNSAKEEKIVSFPHLRLIRQSESDSSMIRTSVQAFGYTRSEARDKAERNQPEYELKDSLLVIHDITYTKNHKWDGTIKKIRLYIPENTKVLIQDPVKHDFEDVVRFRRHYHFEID